MESKTIQLSGGLGNQLFQYAFGKAIGISTGHSVVYDIGKCLNIRDGHIDLMDFVPSDERFTYYKWSVLLNPFLKRSSVIRKAMSVHKEKETFVKDEEAYCSDARYYIGYWQSLDYIEPIKNVLVHDIAYQGALRETEMRVAKELQKPNAVAVHVRRGDYLKHADRYNILDAAYFRKAFDVVSSNLEKKGYKPVIYVFSDDIMWCRSNLKFDCDITFVDKTISTSDVVDFYLLQKAANIIMSNSTFSWWATWLSEAEKGIICVPAIWYMDRSYDKRATNALIKSDWICL